MGKLGVDKLGKVNVRNLISFPGGFVGERRNWTIKIALVAVFLTSTLAHGEFFRRRQSNPDYQQNGQSINQHFPTMQPQQAVPAPTAPPAPQPAEPPKPVSLPARLKEKLAAEIDKLVGRFQGSVQWLNGLQVEREKAIKYEYSLLNAKSWNKASVDRVDTYLKREHFIRSQAESRAAIHIIKAFNLCYRRLVHGKIGLLKKASQDFLQGARNQRVSEYPLPAWENIYDNAEADARYEISREKDRRLGRFLSLETLNPPPPPPPNPYGGLVIQSQETDHDRMERFKRYLSDSEANPPAGNEKPPFIALPRVLFPSSSFSVDNGLLVLDKFGRDVRGGGLALVDWDGYLANPAVELVLKPSPSARLPLQVWISTSENRIYFDNPTTTDADGSKKSKFFNSQNEEKFLFFTEANQEIPIRMAIWPDRDGKNEDYVVRFSVSETLKGQNGEAGEKVPSSFDLPVHVFDQDREPPAEKAASHMEFDSFPYLEGGKEEPFDEEPFPALPSPKVAKHPWKFSLDLDFSHDHSGFFSKAENRRVAEQARDDWAYFLDDLELDITKEKEVQTIVRKQGAPDKNGKVIEDQVANAFPFHDMFIIMTAADTETQPNGYTAPLSPGFHHRKGEALLLKRMAHILIEGIHSPLGYEIDTDDKNHWKFVFTQKATTPRDLYSFILHEMGHALFMNEAYPITREWLARGAVMDPVVEDYQESTPILPEEVHFSDGVNNVSDFASGHGAFGAVGGKMLQRRWIITKLDLLMAQSVGYKLRHMSPFWAMDVPEEQSYLVVPQGKPMDVQLGIRGGVPSYHFSLLSGKLPTGVRLNSFTGKITGTPENYGYFYVLVEVQDQVGNRWIQSLAIEST